VVALKLSGSALRYIKYYSGIIGDCQLIHDDLRKILIILVKYRQNNTLVWKIPLNNNGAILKYLLKISDLLSRAYEEKVEN